MSECWELEDKNTKPDALVTVPERDRKTLAVGEIAAHPFILQGFVSVSNDSETVPYGTCNPC